MVFLAVLQPKSLPSHKERKREGEEKREKGKERKKKEKNNEEHQSFINKITQNSTLNEMTLI